MASEDQHSAGSGDGAFRQYLPDLSIPRFTTMQKQDAHEYAKAFKETGVPPWLHGLYLHWRKLYQEPFKGITNDGHVRPGLFRLQDEGIPIEAILSAAETLLSKLTPDQQATLSYHIDSPEWRTWSNPEFLLSDKGLRLDELGPETRAAALGLLEATLSPEGYAKALAAMRINGFLGQLVGAPRVMNESSYNLVLFGAPSTASPWGFSFYGHHLCLNVFLYRTQAVISPWFTGAEPNLIDSGPHAGTRILQREEALGLRLMQSLPPPLQARAQVYKLLRDPAMPEGRWNHDDQRHLCGAYRDNRVVPYEGVLVSDMAEDQRALVRAILAEYLLYLPARARELRLAEAERWFGETYFCWIGGFGDDDAFYYRIQSPVIIVEFDHHSGVFLTNKEPARFHIHTLLRTPNGGDYGMALRPLIPGMEQGYVWKGEKE
ncbi:hypothetical protein MYCTH_2296360 [Thermothelomyces thermophilus ATCC 42464]|uniref:DUF3500 domain-containing protein n=1 Tax=Thermothelomyces thermophilus (strain ATCC 42464 / BCRC 31852 / DSM 1799) TaxID=573729 RepID=G2Q1F3_THET4|nr:uncharacterized protein MYCTH_2296360 [Thermothelomyces thermophilus ATCC 42464]AEO54143.1 hypothetical protein MYCTH_2296360 [Thermothelomyces thermophilus ATCC 42464]